MQAQIRQVGIEPAQAGNKPACQQTSRAAQDKRGIGRTLRQLCTNTTQSLERIGADIPQAQAGICEFQAASILDEQADT
ncbi:hypothetical protein D3C76_1602920 [compost metagenome]